MKEFLRDYKAWWRSCVINLAIGCIWYGLEFTQFGTLQWNRICDNCVYIIYFVLVAWLLHKSK